MSKYNDHVTEYMFKYYWDKEIDIGGLCTLCGNTGVIDTTETAISPKGIRAGRKNYCICPNGQFLRNKNDGIL